LPELVLFGHRTETLASPAVPERILVYGVTGSGKTWLAERISAATGIPWHAVDDLTWEPGWVPVPEDEQRRRVERIFAEERWVLDTAYGAWLDVALAHADLVVALDFPRWLSLSRLIRRGVARAVDRRPICNVTANRFAICSRGTRSSCGTSGRSAASACGCGRGRRTRTCLQSCCSPGRDRWRNGSRSDRFA
jgi:broad-specificity NMP kinase